MVAVQNMSYTRTFGLHVPHDLAEDAPFPRHGHGDELRSARPVAPSISILIRTAASITSTCRGEFVMNGEGKRICTQQTIQVLARCGPAPTMVSVLRAPCAARARCVCSGTAPGTWGRPGCREHRASARACMGVGATLRCGRSAGAGGRPPGSSCQSRGLCRRVAPRGGRVARCQRT